MPPPRLDSARPSFDSPADSGRYESDDDDNDRYDNDRYDNDRYDNGGDGAASNPWRRQNGTIGDDNRSGLTAIGRTPARPIPAPEDDDQGDPTTDPSPKVQRLPSLEDDRSRPASENRSRPRLSAPVLEASLIRESTTATPRSDAGGVTSDRSRSTNETRVGTVPDRTVPDRGARARRPAKPRRSSESGWYSPGR